MNGYDFESNEFEFLDILTILSFILGVQNIELNQKQIDMLMNEMTEKQDHELEVIIEQNKYIIKLLENKKMDIKWVIDDQMAVVANGGCKFSATSGILNAMLMAEADTIQQYEYGKQALMKLFSDDIPKAEVLCKLVDNIIADEKNHIESFNKASSIVLGVKEPKAEEYNEVIK